MAACWTAAWAPSLQVNPPCTATQHSAKLASFAPLAAVIGGRLAVGCNPNSSEPCLSQCQPVTGLYRNTARKRGHQQGVFSGQARPVQLVDCLLNQLTLVVPPCLDAPHDTAGVPCLAHLTLLNVDVTDAVMHQLARHCPRLQHLAIGRTENNAFGNFVSDAGLAVLAGSCPLDSLCLFRCYSVSDTGLAELTQHGRQLTNLVLHSCPQVSWQETGRLLLGVWGGV